jgi:hypothetical protein
MTRNDGTTVRLASPAAVSVAPEESLPARKEMFRS